MGMAQHGGNNVVRKAGEPLSFVLARRFAYAVDLL